MAVRRRNQNFVFLTGVEECDKLLKSVGKTIGNRVARRVLAMGMRLAAKKIKAQTPVKSVKKAIGSKVKAKRGGVEAKAGAAVGIKRAKAAPKGGTHGGVGIAAENIHWYILGTGERTVTSTGQHVGRMPAHDFVREANVRPQVIALIKREFPKAMEAEIAKEAKKMLKTSRRAR